MWQSPPGLRAAMPRVVAALVIALGAAGLVPGCALDGLLFTELSRKCHTRLPDPAPQTLTGTAPTLPSAQVAVLGGTGKPIAELQAQTDAEGRFAVEVDGATALTNATVQVALGRRQMLVLVPIMPAQSSVLNPPQSHDIAALSPAGQQVDATTTALALLIAGRLGRNGQTLASAAGKPVLDAMIVVHQKLLAGDPAVFAFTEIVARIVAGSVTAAPAGARLPFRLDAGAALLDPAFLLENPVDLDGDGVADATPQVFDQALAAATDTFAVKGCYESDRIRVVLMTRLAKGAKNGNCLEFNPFLWADEKQGSSMFVTGGVHEETPVCSATRSTHCLTPAQVDSVNEMLGKWVPNKQPMYDDGSHGDATAGDGIWSTTFDLPFWEASAAPDGAGLRLAYKFTYGSQGQGWTGSEEFPGNQRLLELVDVNGDGLVVRFDPFADETTNKDKANQLATACGGENPWLVAAKPDCTSDTRERKVDLDGDCAVDDWPQPGVGPLAVACPEP